MINTLNLQKNNAVYEIVEVLPVMTNNFEESIKEGAKVCLSDLITAVYFG